MSPDLLISDCEQPEAPSFASAPPREQLALRLACDRQQQTFVAQQYATYPFRLSNVFRLEGAASRRAYLYLMNISPGLLAGDRLKIGVRLGQRAHLYLTDQAATKVHCMAAGTDARVQYAFQVEAEARLEFIPEPLILYADATLHQTVDITLHSTASLVYGEIIVPGRIARGEQYAFDDFWNRLRVFTPGGDLLFADQMRLTGQHNPFRQSHYCATYPLQSTLVAVLPTVNLAELAEQLQTLPPSDARHLIAGCSPLPNCNGLLVRAMADNLQGLQRYTREFLNRVREMQAQSPLPDIPK